MKMRMRKQFGRRGPKLAVVASRPAQPARLLNERELAELLGISQWTIRGWRRMGHGPAFVRLGPKRQRRPRQVRYRRADVDAYLERQLVKPEAR